MHGSCIRDDSEHIFAIEKYFSEVINAVNVADRHLPRVKPFVRKDYWNEELSNLKEASCDAFKLWKENGRPSTGPIRDIKVKAHLQYKRAIRTAKREFDQSSFDRMHVNLLDRNTFDFWKSWKGIHGKRGILWYV